MIKKSFLLSLLIPMLFTSLALPMPSYAHHPQTSWFQTNSLIASIGSFFNSILSTVKTSVKSLFTKDNNGASSDGLIQANCIPPVPPKPTGIDSGSKYGSLSIAPEVSTAGPNNIITLSASTNLDPTKTISFMVPIGTSKSDLIDRHPKGLSAVNFNQYNGDSEKGYGTYGWGVSTNLGNENTKLPTDQIYWVKLRTRYSTIPERAKNATDADGWRKIEYQIGNQSTGSRGTKGLYVGREQKPSLVTIIPNYNLKYSTTHGPFLKPFTVVPNEYFEIQTKSLGQPGIITMDVKYGKVLGDIKRQVKADETVTWKIQPLRFGPVLLRELGLVNTCGEDYFIDPAQTARLSELDQFKFPVAYDFEKLTSDMVNLSVGARDPSLPSLTVSASYENSFPIFSSLFTKGETKVPVPDIPITFRAVYKDNPGETAKNLILRAFSLSESGEKGRSGEITINTLNDSTGIGSAYISVVGSKLTPEDAKRGIIIKTTSSRFPGLSAEMIVPLVVPKNIAPQPKPPVPTPTPQPTPQEQSKKGLPQNLVISPNRALEGLREGDKITFTAKLAMSDGSMQSVTTNLTWSVVGKIGSITSGGVFTAKLDPLLAEYGEGVGSIIAIYKDASGKEFLAQTPIFKVQTFVLPDIDAQG